MTELSTAQVRLSRRLSLVLRHRPETAGLTLDANGWVPVADLLAALRLSRADLDMIVENNDKSRFAIARRDDGTDWIRASQGHSRRVENMTPVVLLGTGEDHNERDQTEYQREGDITRYIRCSRYQSKNVIDKNKKENS